MACLFRVEFKNIGGLHYVRRILDYEGKGDVAGEVLSFKRSVYACAYVVGEIVIMKIHGEEQMAMKDWLIGTLSWCGQQKGGP